jgi:PEP-CTERM motif-containing protein
VRCRNIKLVVPILAVLAVPAVAAAATVTCPDPIGTNTRTYEVGPATDCVYGTGNIVGGTVGDPNEDFLNGNGTNDGGGSVTLGGNWTGLNSTNQNGTGITGLTFTFLNGGNNGTFTLDTSQFTFTQFALGIVDGGTPKWAVFLLDMSAAVNGILTGTWDIDGTNDSGDFNELAGGFSHAALYGRGSGSTGQVLPEPATLAMFGFGLIAVAYRARRRSKLN